MNSSTQQSPEEIYAVFGSDVSEPVRRNLGEHCRQWLAKKHDIDQMAGIIPQLPIVKDQISLRGLYEVMLPKMQRELYTIERNIRWLQKYFDLMNQTSFFRQPKSNTKLDAKAIKNRVDIVDLIQADVELRPSGRSLKGCCPFHNDRSPSFHVYPDSQRWWCYSCNEGGDVFSYICKKDGSSFKDALTKLNSYGL